MKRFSNRARKQSGAAMIEAALVLPVLILLCGVVFNFVASLHEQTKVLQVARVTARAAAKGILTGPFKLDDTFRETAKSFGIDPDQYVINGITEKIDSNDGDRLFDFFSLEVSRKDGGTNGFSSFGVSPHAKVVYAMEG